MSIGERENAEKRINSLLDQLSERNVALRMCEAQREVAVLEREVCSNMMAAGAAAMARILALCDGRVYVLETDLLTALLP